MLINRAMLTTFSNSDVVRSIENLLNSGGELRGLHWDQVTSIRNYLIFRLLLANGQRMGALLGLTPRALMQANVTRSGATVLVRLRHDLSFRNAVAVYYILFVEMYICVLLHHLFLGCKT